MGIMFHSNTKTFHLSTKDTSYIFKILDSGHLRHMYWGKKISVNQLDYLIRGHNFGSFLADTDNIQKFQLEVIPQEYPTYGTTDLRSPVVELLYGDGTSAVDLRYKNHDIIIGKNKIEGLPTTYALDQDNVESLDITLVDRVKSVKIILTYSVFNDYNAITRSVRITNDSEEDIKITRALSANVDLAHSNLEMIQLSGAWARERDVYRTKIRPGLQGIDSKRGSSSHAQNPFLALVTPETTDDFGSVYAMSLVYSGNFLANIEVDMYSQTRFQMGINPFDFTWVLEPHQSFQTPEVVMVYSDDGLNQMSQTFHKLYRERLCRGAYKEALRPTLINNWEATYFDFNEQKIKEIAKEAKSLGIELFVLDDGWFGERNNDDSSLGDWVVNEDKLKGGLKKLAEEINSMGMQFGLWFEPEMISPVSKLYEKHPDWCLHIPNRTRSEARKQLILDLSRKEVCDYIVESVSSILASAPISYVKWDMNRNMTEIGSSTLSARRQRETAHRYMLGLYDVLERITTKFPHILFESCSGGGGRFDPGMLYYMPQTWTSDNTDAIKRLDIQFGTSLVYPPISMGCHVSAIPNHQMHRITPLETRGIVAMAGNFGYELDVTRLTDNEKDLIKKQVTLYKKIRETIQLGTYYRLTNMLDKKCAAWMFISRELTDVVVSYVKPYADVNVSFSTVKLKGLDECAKYEVMGHDLVLGGDELMEVGLLIPHLEGDYAAMMWQLKKISS